MSKLPLRSLLLWVSLIGGCTLTPKPQTITLAPMPVISPTRTQKITVAIEPVTDARVFSIKAANPADQSLATVESLDGANTSKAVAQIRTNAGSVFRDLFAEQDVRDLVKATVEESFRRAGYTVSKTGESDTVPVGVRILRFWAYNTESWTFRFTFDIEVDLTGDVRDLRLGKKFSSQTILHSAVAATGRSFENTIFKGLEKFTGEMQTALE